MNDISGVHEDLKRASEALLIGKVLVHQSNGPGFFRKSSPQSAARTSPQTHEDTHEIKN